MRLYAFLRYFCYIHRKEKSPKIPCNIKDFRAFSLANNPDFDTSAIVRDSLCTNRPVLCRNNYNNPLKYGLRILKPVLQESDHFCFHLLKSTTENNVLIHAKVNDKQNINPYLQVCISADKYDLYFLR